MQINPVSSAFDAYTAAVQTAAELEAAENKQRAAEDAAASADEIKQDVVDFREQREQEKAFWQKQLEEMQTSSNTMEVQTSKPKDPTSQLTALLVSATGQFEVRQVIAEASKSMLSLQVTAATGNGDDAKLARQILKKLQRLIDRGYEKIEGLNNEDLLRMQQRRAEQAKQRQRAGEIKDELRQRIQRRKNKERKYLDEESHERLFGSGGESFNPYGDAKLDAATEAQIAVQAEAQAAVEVAAEGGGAGGGFVAAGGGAAGPEAAGADGGAAAAAGGGAEGAAGGGIDISV